MTNNAAERAIDRWPLGRKNYLFAGSDSGGRRAAILYTLVETAGSTASTPRHTCATSWPGSPITR